MEGKIYKSTGLRKIIQRHHVQIGNVPSPTAQLKNGTQKCSQKFSGRIKRNLFSAALFVAMSFLLGCSSEPSLFLHAYIENEKAKYAINKDKKEQALNHILEAKEKLNDNAIIDSNLGAIFDANEKAASAAKSFFASVNDIEKYSKKDQFAIYYNWGVFLGAENQIDQALWAYQKALDIEPTSIAAKHNIELLIKKQQQQDQQQQDKKEEQENQQDQQNKNGESNSNNQNEQDKKEEKPEDQDGKEDESKDSEKDQEQDRKGNKKYKPRPFQGNQLSEGDVKKILGELSRQDQQIRLQYDQQKRKEPKNEKDW